MPSCEDCKQKGLCCNFAVIQKGIMYILPNHSCKYLDKDNTCSVYENRHDVNPECGTMEMIAANGGVPPQCNFKKEGWQFKYEKVLIARPKLERRLFKLVKDSGLYSSSLGDMSKLKSNE